MPLVVILAIVYDGDITFFIRQYGGGWAKRTEVQLQVVLTWLMTTGALPVFLKTKTQVLTIRFSKVPKWKEVFSNSILPTGFFAIVRQPIPVIHKRKKSFFIYFLSFSRFFSLISVSYSLCIESFLACSTTGRSPLWESIIQSFHLPR